ncbi:hypothetical protein [Ectopseudomonas alcaliphila]|uniref:Uncharacterized protein n=1 Tax=Ectopseudomonas alcaliphila TaxID=101564 RepID=A0A1G7MI55_9GAMM|nr:hypothetical protein [Pseudomonas alcaliphila]MDX5994958.1 hypothetical protein [Pseudomonas alcaliphila]SDF61442.1 hypothetical protein SAMN05216575_10961 [Pseudomonas alcaliphila]
MAVIKHHKYVASLPGTLEANSIYYVRAGSGFDIYVTNSSGTIVAYPLNRSIDVWEFIPIGAEFPIDATTTGVAIPPTDNPNYRYIKLTASDSYNTGVLTSESVSGSAPLVQATAVINDAGSPMNGQTVRLINTERRSIRPGSSGTVEADALQNITGSITNQQQITAIPTGVAGAIGKSGVTTSIMSRSGTGAQIDGITVDFDASRVARTANETRIKSLGRDYYKRIR